MIDAETTQRSVSYFNWKSFVDLSYVNTNITKTEYEDKQYAFVFHPNKNWVEPDIVFIEAVIYTSLKSKLLKQGTWVDVVSQICSVFFEITQ